MSAALRLAATLVYLGLPLAAAGTVAFNAVRAAELDAAREAAEASLGPLLARLERAPAEAEDDTADVWLPGDTEALAAAALQARLVDLVVGAGARPLEVAALPADPEADPLQPTLQMRISFEGNNTALVGTLLAVETGLPLLEVASLAIAVGGSEEDADPVLRVDLTVRGHLRAPA